jgi:hypothetical protein
VINDEGNFRRETVFAPMIVAHAIIAQGSTANGETDCGLRRRLTQLFRS